MIRVTIGNEDRHERENPDTAKIYPKGIHGCIREFLSRESDMKIRTATFDEPEHGLTEDVLSDTDVLIFWSHILQEEFSDAAAERIRDHVNSGMGLIALHSAHYSKILKLLMGPTMTLTWKPGESEKLWCINPAHPIAAGIPEMTEIPQEEMYGEPFDIPKPDEVVFGGWFSNGHIFRSGCVFTRGRGRIFYFQPGHEEYPVYHIPEIQMIIRNAVRFCAPNKGIRVFSENREVVG